MAKKKKNKKVITKSTRVALQTNTGGTDLNETGRWNGHVFVVSASTILSFETLQIKGSSSTKNKKKGKQNVVSRQSGNPTEVTLTIPLYAYTGVDVRQEAMDFISEAISGKKDYFYVGSKKLVSCKLMLTDASVKEVEISGNGIWTRADVSLTMKQCTKGSTKNKSSKSKKSGKSSSGNSGSNKKSVKSTSTVSSSNNTNVVQKVKNALTKIGKSTAKTILNAFSGSSSSSSTKKSVKTANQTISAMKNQAKKQSVAMKFGSGGSGTSYSALR